ncbi:MAG: amino acid adenylation domain-containing protein [Acidobacteria bacterium]|nr:amino acid adenylation domain-containing protein [Acidobacteriota bacterium]
MNDLAERLRDLTPAQRQLLKQQLRQKNSKSLKAHVIPAREEHRALPLSLDQERLWFIDQIEPNSIAYNLCSAFRLTGQLDLPALERSVDELLRRHEALRTTFAASDGVPQQVIAPSAKFSLEQADLSETPAAGRDEAVRQFIAAKIETPFDLAAGPLVRASLLRLGKADYVLVITLHHIVTDKLSQDLLWQELTTLYDAYSKGEPSPLAELQMQYADFALWQRQWLEGEVMRARLDYWKQRLEGAPLVLELPTDRPRPAVRTYRGARQSRVLSTALWAELKALSLRENVTLFMTLLAVFYVWLVRYTGREDLLVGTPFTNRELVESEGLIGFLLNMLVVRVDLSGDPAFRELLGRVREAALGAYAHDLPFARLVQELQLERDLSRNPLYQVTFLFVESHDVVVKQPGLNVSRMEVDLGLSNVDLTLGIRDQEHEPTLLFDYSTDIFEDTTISRIMTHFETLLAGIVADPAKRLSELPLLAPAEETRLLEEYNDTACSYPHDKTIPRLFEEQASRTPDAVAVVFETQQFTYSELNARANQLARRLRELGVERETLVGVLMERSLEMVVGLLGVLKAGAAYLPLDPTYPPERLSYMLADARPRVLLTRERRVPEGLSAGAARVLDLCADRGEMAGLSSANLNQQTVPDNTAYVIYTSGSTGKPKGVCAPHRGAVNRFHWMWETYPFAPDEVCCHKTSLNFGDSVWEIFGLLLRGVKVVLVPDETAKDPRRLLAYLAAWRVTRLVVVPSLLRMLLDSDEDIQSRLPNLKYWVTSGEALSRELLQLFREQLPQATLINLYGSSEVAADVTCYEAHEEIEGVSVPIGRPIANSQAYLLDSTIRPVPVGVTGELYVGGAGLARGYLNRPALTAEKFVPHPFSAEPGARLYKTGDLARYRPDGEIEFLGRADHQVKVRGHRIELGEVEAALAAHPSVRESAVVLGEDTAGEARLVAYVVAKASVETAGDELRRFLQEKLPAFMIPAVFVRLDALPLMPSGKVDRCALPAPEEKDLHRERDYVAPRTPLEEQLAGIWAEVLSLKQVGARDNFFELGGHSLTATRVVSQVRERLHTELTLRQLFTYPTLAELAQQIEAALTIGRAPRRPPILPAKGIPARPSKVLNRG